MRMYDVVTGQKIDESFKDSDMLNLADLTKRPSMFSYSDGNEFVFFYVLIFVTYTIPLLNQKSY